MNDHFVTVDTVPGRHVAEPIKAYLRANGVTCETSQEAGGAYGFSVGGLAKVEIRVPSREERRAKRLIREFKEHMGQEPEVDEPN